MNKAKSWAENASLLNREFGGKTLQHCKLLSGRQFAVTPGFLRACCSATHEKGTPTICTYNGPDVHPSDFFKGLREIIYANQAKSGPCSGCRLLRQIKMPRHFVAGYLHHISLHDYCGCNARCVYCAGSEYTLPQKFVASFDHVVLFKNLLKNNLIKPLFTSVAWGGGEPTLLKSFEKTVDLLRTSGVRQIINTNGICFSPAIEKALKAKLATVQISVDSGTNDIYSKVKGNVHCDDVWKTARRYADANDDFILKYIVFYMNSDQNEAECFVRRAHEAGVKKICISVDTRSVFSHSSQYKEVTAKEFAAAASIYNLAKTAKIKCFFETIWLPQHIRQIEKTGNFKVSPFFTRVEFVKHFALAGFSLAFRRLHGQLRGSSSA